MDRNNLKSEDARERLISLIDEKKSVFHGGAAAIVRREFGLIAEARKNGASWKEIVNTIGFPGKEDGFAVAFFRERRRREKKGIKTPEKTGKEVVPEKKKWVPAPKEEKKESKTKILKTENRKTENKHSEVKYKSSFNIDVD